MFRPHTTTRHCVTVSTQQFTKIQRASLLQYGIDGCRYKFHISIPSAQYTQKVVGALNAFLIKWIESGRGDYSVLAFKHTNGQVFADQLTMVEKQKQVVVDLFASLNAKAADLETHYAQFEKYFKGVIRNMPTLAQVKAYTPAEKASIEKKLLSELDDVINARRRFHEGTQYTVYLPKNFKQADVNHFVQALNTYLQAIGIAPGKFFKNDLQVADNISIRQMRYQDDGQYFAYDTPQADRCYAHLKKSAFANAVYASLKQPSAQPAPASAATAAEQPKDGSEAKQSRASKPKKHPAAHLYRKIREARAQSSVPDSRHPPKRPSRPFTKRGSR